MIVLVSGSSRAQDCATAIEAKTHRQTLLATSLAGAAECLKRQEVDVVVIDESLQHFVVDKLMVKAAVTAVPIYVNLSLHSEDRVVLEVSGALQRITLEKAACVRAAAEELRHRLRGEVTAILLNAELALLDSSLPAGAGEKLQVIREMAEQMRRNLEEPKNEPRLVGLKPRLVMRPASPRVSQ